jgi:cell division protein FtsA
MVIHSGNSIRYNDFLSVGSLNITTDISTVLHTPPAVAEEVKIKYGTLKPRSNELIVLPDLGDENSSHEVDISVIINVIYMRVEEALMILAKMLSESGYKEYASAGIVLTGGMAKIEGLRELATAIFDNMPVRIARPREFSGSIDVFKDPANSCAIGLCLYGAGYFTPYEIDSERKLRHKDEIVLRPNPFVATKEFDEHIPQTIPSNNLASFDDVMPKVQPKQKMELDLKIDDNGDKDVLKENIALDKVNSVSKFMNYLKNLF